MFSKPAIDTPYIDVGKKDSLTMAQRIKERLQKEQSFFSCDSADERDPLIYFQRGYIQYNLNYRARIDTPYSEDDIYQHLGMANGQFVLAGSIPVNVTYIERQSNSALFKDYRDVRVDVNGPELQRLQNEKLKKQLLKQVGKLEDSAVNKALDANQYQLSGLKGLLQRPDIAEMLIRSKENLIHLNERDGSCKWKDSIEIYSRKFIDVYETNELRLTRLQNKVDSLRQLYTFTRQRIQELVNLINGRISTPDAMQEIGQEFRRSGLNDSRIKRLPGILYALRSFSVGQTMPDFSPLTLKNVNVKGFSAEFNYGRWYGAVAAGLVDLRFRDFAYGKSNSSPQYVYAASLGTGRKESSHVFVTGYKGRKQIYSINDPSSEIYGVSTEWQYVYRQNHRVSAEVAQSSIPASAAGPGKASTFNLRDQAGRAYYFQWQSYFPQLMSSLEGRYQKTGLHFQSFNSYRVNAAMESWSLKYDQYLFGRILRVTAGIKKNDFENQLIAQNYSSNTVFKTLQATFRKRKWPTVSIGYIPSSQYAIIDSQVYESRYQTLTINASHYYHLGTASAVTNTVYSKFYNSGSDSGFIYYNAGNVCWYQQIIFKRHTAILGANITRNGQFNLEVFQVGASAALSTHFQVEIGAKINYLNQSIAKSGFYGKSRIYFSKLGELAAWYDDSYLPGFGEQLVRNEQFNISFTKRIK